MSATTINWHELWLGIWMIKGGPTQRAYPTVGSLRVFGQFAWLEVGSVKVVSPRPTHQRVTPAVETVEKVGESSTKLQGSVR